MEDKEYEEQRMQEYGNWIDKSYFPKGGLEDKLNSEEKNRLITQPENE